MLKLRKGCRVPFPEKLEEGYEVCGNQITANVSVDKIEQIMEHFIRIHQEPLFFILELPTMMTEETEIRPGVVDAFHKDVYYIDGCTPNDALTVLNKIAKLAINDGMCAFGFGCHESKDEIVFGKYNVTVIFSKEVSKFDAFFKEHGIEKKDSLICAWDTFSMDTPGECEKVITDGLDVYSIPILLAEWGIYKAEKREDS